MIKNIKFYIISIFTLFCVLQVNDTVFAIVYEQNYCINKCLIDYSVENCQSIANERPDFDFESSQCLRPYFFIAKEKKAYRSILAANELQNDISLQSSIVEVILKFENKIVLGNSNSESDFSSQKNYIRLGGVERVGTVGRVAAKTSSTLLQGAAKSNFGRFVKKIQLILNLAPHIDN